MISKIVKWFKGPKKSPIDQLIELTGVDKVSLWNGINYNSEYKLAPSGMNEYECNPSLFPFIRIGIGKYRSGYGDFIGGDYEVCRVLEVTIDENKRIRRVKRNYKYYNGKGFPPKVEKKIDSLFEKLKIMDQLNTRNPVLLKGIESMFNLPVDVRYRHACLVDDILVSNKDNIDAKLESFLGSK